MEEIMFLIFYGTSVFFTVVFFGWGLFKIRDKITVVDAGLVIVMGLFSWLGFVFFLIVFSDELKEVVLWRKKQEKEHD